ncbi:4'-phosphopantetheinyl transferase family protein [Cellulosimicrobium marinum]|uniref:4'-phosphopantetheinyl transferase family protein n=1 Tax=Cellulosimicrobium marinum TaxID=1638992 RepID=UPI001E527577|nr:4'-phosphopantetheinyl transferase superfamily protein [Cellulosimicrobium marinum]MCB7137864.1 4'-phosphopantetheinyl transferase superfamily protein [Cellulosimicrobium marinum]
MVPAPGRPDLGILPGVEPVALAAPSTPPGSTGRTGLAVRWGTTARCAPWALPLADRVLDSAERARARAFAHEADRATYVVSHVVLRLLLARRTGTADAGGLGLRRDACPTCGGPHGRPVLDGGPHVSLSHTAGVFAVALADVPVGVDVETPPTAAAVRDVNPSLHPRERAEIDASPADVRSAAFARAWTRKEAYLKALGTGLSRGLALDDVGAGPAPRSPGPGWHVADLDLPGPCTGAVAWADVDHDAG